MADDLAQQIAGKRLGISVEEAVGQGARGLSWHRMHDLGMSGDDSNVALNCS
jgi:hypothetical protein